MAQGAFGGAPLCFALQVPLFLSSVVRLAKVREGVLFPSPSLLFTVLRGFCASLEMLLSSVDLTFWPPSRGALSPL